MNWLLIEASKDSDTILLATYFLCTVSILNLIELVVVITSSRLTVCLIHFTLEFSEVDHG